MEVSRGCEPTSAPTPTSCRAPTVSTDSHPPLDSRLHTAVLDDAANVPEEAGPARLSGLHAKVIIVDRQVGARILIGSANATTPLRDNIEVMVGQGSYATFGVAPTLAALGALVEPYPTVGGAQPNDDEKAERQPSISCASSPTRG